MGGAFCFFCPPTTGERMVDLAKERAASAKRRAASTEAERVYTPDPHALPQKLPVAEGAAPVFRGANLGYGALACALVADTIHTLETAPPPKKPPKDPTKHTRWVGAWREWCRARARDVAFMRDATRSVVWVEAAGLDYGDTLGDLERRGLLYDAMSRVPLNMAGYPIVAESEL